MNGVNKVILVGFIGQDFEVKKTTGGNSFAYASVGVQDSWRDKETGENKSKTTWLSVLFSGKIAENAAKLMKKGAQVYIEAKLQNRTKEVNGQKQTQTDIVVNSAAGGNFQVLIFGKSGNAEGQNAPQQQQQYQPQQQPQHVNEPAPMTAEDMNNQPPMDFDDDIPF